MGSIVHPPGKVAHVYGLHVEDVMAALANKYGQGTNLVPTRDLDEIVAAARERERKRLLARLEETIQRRQSPCWIYFIGGDVGCIKIGISSQPEVRFKTIQSNSPIPVRIMAMTKGFLEDEQAYHRRFAEHRRHGEWFERAPEIMAEITALNAANDDVPMEVAA